MEKTVMSVQDLVEHFILNFEKKSIKVYLQQLLDNISSLRREYIIDFNDLLQFDPVFAKMIENDSKLLDSIKKEIYELHCHDWVLENGEYKRKLEENGYSYEVSINDFKLIIENLGEKVKISDIGTKVINVGRIIRVAGLVVSKSFPKLEMVKGHYRHLDLECGGDFDFPEDDIQVLEITPRRCPLCGKSGNIVLIPEQSKYRPWQKIIIQEDSEDLRQGETPRTLDIELTDDFVDKVKIGDKIEITGVLSVKTRPQKINNKMILDYYIEAKNIKILESNSIDISLSEEDIRKIDELSKRDDIIDLIIKSIAPSLYDLAFEKEAVALALFGGVSKMNPDGTRIRGDIHVLFIGDPGLAKSQILQFVKKTVPRSIYVDCANSSGVGLTASAVFDNDLKEWRIDAGAFVLADKSIVLLDEVDKLREEDRNHLNVVMEQQIVSVNKANRSVELPAEVSVIAVANPKFRRWIKDKGIEENIQFSPDFLSRFDIISIIKDEADEEKDRSLVDHITNIEINKKIDGVIDADLLRKYIVYARRNVKPRMTEEAMKILKNFWVETRQKTKDSLLQFTPRQLEALQRISEAYAKMRLSKSVSSHDAFRAINFYSKMLQKLNIDVETGLTQEFFDKMMKIYNIIDELSHSPVTNYRAKLGDILLNARERFNIDEDEAERIINYLNRNGKITKVGNLEYKT